MNRRKDLFHSESELERIALLQRRNPERWREDISTNLMKLDGSRKLKTMEKPTHSDFGRLIGELKKKKIIIYGAGKIGTRVFRFFSRFNIPVCFFWDAKAELIREVESSPVLEPDFERIAMEDRENYVVIVTIFSENICHIVHDRLNEAGFHNVISDRKFIDSLLYFECKKNVAENKFCFDLKTCYFCPVSKETEKRCDIFDDYVRKHFVRGNQNVGYGRKLIVPSMGVLISNRCTLTCKGCNHLREYYNPSDNVDIAAKQIGDDLHRIIEAVDLIFAVVIVGGEPFLHKDIEDIIGRVLDLPKIGIVHIISNGTVALKSDSVFERLSNPRVIVEISGYRDRIPKKLQNSVELFIAKLARYRINYRYTQQMQWFDFGGFEQRSYSEEDLRRVHSSCCFVSNDMFDGKLHKCSRSVFGNFLGKIPDFESDYVDIRRTAKEALRAKLEDFFGKKYAEVCRFCSGTSTETIEAGQQIERRQKQNRK